jgi:hypothetical protein
MSKFLSVAALLSTLAILTVAVSGCGDGADSSGRDVAGNGPQNPTDDPPDSGKNSNEDATARDAFSKTLVAGDREWTMKNVVVNYVKRESSSNKVDSSWTVNCGDNNARITGRYPSVSLQMSPFSCGNENHPFELSQLEMITRYLSYTAKHIPAYPVEPNQFRLILQGSDNSHFHFSSQESLNAIVKSNAVMFDFLGIEEDEIALGSNRKSNYFAEITFLGEQNGALNRMTVSYDEDSAVRNQSVHIQISADLQ